jgi:hypothetical protein
MSEEIFHKIHCDKCGKFLGTVDCSKLDLETTIILVNEIKPVCNDCMSLHSKHTESK